MIHYHGLTVFLEYKTLKIYRAYRTELDPNNVQQTLFWKCAGTARWAYNWGLDQKQKAYEVGEKVPTTFDLSNQLTILKHTTHLWLNEVSKWSPTEALKNLEKSYDKFYKNCKLKKQGKFTDKIGYPKYKSRRKGNNSFTLRNITNVTEKSIFLPRIGIVSIKEHNYLPTNKPVKSATISTKAGRWFVSVLVEELLPDWVGVKDDHSIVGVDLGVKTLAICSDGQSFPNLKPLKKHEKKLKRLQRKASKKKLGSNNRKKANTKVVRQLFQISNIRKDNIHKITTHLTKTKSCVVIEDLNVKGMLKNHRLAGSIGDVSLGEFRRQLEYKGLWYGCQIVKADRFFPSSKRCSGCGTINQNLTLDKRSWSCVNCLINHDRDTNASMNLEWWGTTHQYTAESAETNRVGSTRIYACGEEGSGRRFRDGETTLRRSKNETGSRKTTVGTQEQPFTMGLETNLSYPNSVLGV